MNSPVILENTNNAPLFGLALGGGGARGLSHILVLEALDEMGIKPAVIAGTSIGAIFGACYAAGMTGKEIRDYSLELLQSKRALFRHLIDNWPGHVSNLLNPLTPSIFKGETVIEIVLPEGLPDKLEQLPIPLKIIATNFYEQKEAVLTQGPLIPAVTASSALPYLFQAVEFQGDILVDGGFVNPLPFDHVSKGMDFVLAVDVNGQPRGRKNEGLPGSLEVSLGASQILLGSLVKEKLKHSRPDILISPDVGQYLVLDFLKAREILSACAMIKDEVKKKVDAQMMRVTARKSVRP